MVVNSNGKNIRVECVVGSLKVRKGWEANVMNPHLALWVIS